MRTITLHFLLLALSLAFVPSTWAITINWSKICDISWTDEVVDFTAGGAVSPLNLPIPRRITAKRFMSGAIKLPISPPKMLSI